MGYSSSIYIQIYNGKIYISSLEIDMRTLLIVLLIITLILLSIAFYHYYTKNKETFADNLQDKIDETIRIANTIGSGDIPEGTTYVEKDIPLFSNLKLYLTAFSDRTNYNNEVEIYVPETQRWNNFVAPNQSFFINKGTTTILPAILRDGGMPLKDTALEGIQPEHLNTSGYELPSFSASFFIKINTVPIIDNTELFSIPLEAPNYARLTLVKTDTGKYKFAFQLGENTEDNILQTEEIDSNIIINTTNPLSITIALDKANSKIFIFIGTVSLSGASHTYTNIQKTDKVYTSMPSCILGNSRMSINKTKSALDAGLYGFMYHNISLTESQHQELSIYLQKQKTEPVRILNTINDTLATNLNNLRNLISSSTVSQGLLQQQLDACKASLPQAVKIFGHKIHLDGEIPAISTADLRGCSMLQVKQRLRDAVSGTATQESNKSRFKIDYPDNVGGAISVAP
jgi:hypothetical protein